MIASWRTGDLQFGKKTLGRILISPFFSTWLKSPQRASSSLRKCCAQGDSGSKDKHDN
jgi:hypothetical protein